MAAGGRVLRLPCAAHVGFKVLGPATGPWSQAPSRLGCESEFMDGTPSTLQAVGCLYSDSRRLGALPSTFTPRLLTART